MTFDDHWTKVLSFNPALAENPFLRPLAEAAWNAAAVAEREACAAACEGQTEGFAATSTWDEAALACARTIRMRSNDKAQGADGGFIAGGSPGATSSAARDSEKENDSEHC